MKQPKKRIIFSTEGRTFDTVKQDLIDCHDPADDAPGETWSPTDDQVYASMDLDTAQDWDDAKYELEKHLGDFDRFLVVGSCGLWNGNFSGGKFCKNLHEIMECMKSCDSYEMFDRNGRLCFEGDHHDGHNSFEVKALTHRGWEMAQREGWENSRSLHEKLWKSNLYTKDLHFAHDMFGCPKREYEKRVK